MTHLESLTAEYLSYLGFLLRTNIWVGKLPKGGWEGELDIVGFHPKDERVVHYETSLDAWSWERRREKYTKKFETGRKYIFEEVFPSLNGSGIEIESVAVLPSRPRDGATTIGGGRLLSVDELVLDIRRCVSQHPVFGEAIPESYPLLRTIQMAEAGYKKRLG